MLAELYGGVDVLFLDGLVDKDLEGGKVMKIQLTAEARIESPTEPLMLLGVGGDLFGCITSQSVEFTTKIVHGPSSLSEVAELLTFVVHKTLWNVMLTERSAGLVPCSGWTCGMHVEIVFPPRSCCTLKVV